MDVCQDSGSKQTVITSLIVNGALFLVFVFTFIAIRSKNKLVYDKRTYSSAVTSVDRPLPLDSGPISWVIDLLKRSDAQILRDLGLDGYLFIRYLRFLFYITIFGMILLLPILLPVNATNGYNCKGLDLLSFGNIQHKNRYYAHAILSWVFFGGVIFGIYRELMFYVGIRQAVLTSEAQKHLLSNRTVLIEDVPYRFLNKDYLNSVFTGIKYLFITYDSQELRQLVESREELANKLEDAETSLIRNAIENRLKEEEKGNLDTKPAVDIKDFTKKPPTHRPKFFSCKKVESIPFLSKKISGLNDDINELRNSYTSNPKRSSVFIVFLTQNDAEVAAQMLSFHRPLRMARRTIGVHPDNVIWSNMSLHWYQILPFTAIAGVLSALLCILWAIPVAFVGFISQISHLVELFSWLKFIERLPKVLYGLISSLLPIILLAVLMMLLPIIIRKIAKFSGSPTKIHVEYYTQNVYFMFQVIQVFIMMTLTSSVGAAINQLLKNPSKILKFLHMNLPQASNIFIAYLLLQGLTVPGGMLLQIVPVILYHVFSNFLDNTPRKIWNRRNTIGGTEWGTVYPVYSNMIVITLSYSIIAPIILPFAAVLFSLGYIAFLNNLAYSSAKTNLRGINFSRGLHHIFVGIYIAEFVLIVLFVFAKSWGPIVIEAFLIFITIWIHIVYNDSFDPVLFNLPASLLYKSSEKPQSEFNFSTQSNPDFNNDHIYKSRHFNSHYGNQFSAPDADINTYEGQNYDPESALMKHNTNSRSPSSLPSGTFFDRIFRPYLYYNADMIRQEMLVEQFWNEVPAMPDAESESKAFDDPSMNAPTPTVWFPEDPYGWAEEQQSELRNADIDARISGSWYDFENEKKKVKIAVTDKAEECPLYTPPVSI